MESSNPTLNDLMAAAIPPAFLRELNDCLPGIYREANKSVSQNPLFGEPEAKYLLGHQRRALCEAKLRDLAAVHGIAVEMVKPRRGGCEHVQLTVGRFRFGECHVPSPCAFPTHSESREQYSMINEHLSQGVLFPADSDPGPAEIFGIFIHTHKPGATAEFRCSHIGFPDSNFSEWMQPPTPLLDIIDQQAILYQHKEDLRAPIQQPEPILKLGVQTAQKNLGMKDR